jgi:UDP-3-O-[3-hydroxymyristoyl] N-acetylglucosamine deacetylase
MTQATLREAVRFSGVGLHTGSDATVEIRPARPNFGLKFLVDGAHIPATAGYVTDTSRSTVIGRGARSVATVEHLLSALFGLGITNAEIAVSGAEVPVLDGSARPFVEAISRVGTQSQPQEAAMLALSESFEFREGDRALILLPNRSLRVRFVADFPAPVGTLYFDREIDSQFYANEIAPARTFGYLHEVESLLSRGLARGGTLENAIVFGPDGPMQQLRWPDEVVRHKVLDLLGDLALLGMLLQCDVIAIKSGHGLHVRAVKTLLARYGESARAARPAS